MVHFWTSGPTYPLSLPQSVPAKSRFAKIFRQPMKIYISFSDGTYLRNLEQWIPSLRALLHWSLRAHDCWNLESFIVWNCQVHLTLFYTRAWGPKGPRDQGDWNGWQTYVEYLHGMQRMQRQPQGGGFTTKAGDYNTWKNHNSWLIIT